MEQRFVMENARERERLRSLVSRISDKELCQPLNAGWTVAAALAHLAFWDQWALVLMRKWKTSPVSVSPVDSNLLNDALLPLSLTIPPREAANLAVKSAEAIDRELEEASPEFITAIEGLRQPARLYRATHRKLHLDEIESTLSKERDK